MGKTIRRLEMAKRRVMFTFSPEVITEPIIYNLGQQFRLATNIRRADISENRGWVVLELEGVRVNPVVSDTVEG